MMQRNHRRVGGAGLPGFGGVSSEHVATRLRLVASRLHGISVAGHGDLSALKELLNAVQVSLVNAARPLERGLHYA